MHFTCGFAQTPLRHSFEHAGISAFLCGRILPTHRIYICATCEKATEQRYLRRHWGRIGYLTSLANELLRTAQTGIAGARRREFGNPLLQLLAFAVKYEQLRAELGNFPVRVHLRFTARGIEFAVIVS